MKSVRFPSYESHEIATKVGCFNCASPLDGQVKKTGFPRGCWRQKCPKCGFITFYDLHDEDLKIIIPSFKKERASDG